MDELLAPEEDWRLSPQHHTQGKRLKVWVGWSLGKGGGGWWRCDGGGAVVLCVCGGVGGRLQ